MDEFKQYKIAWRRLLIQIEMLKINLEDFRRMDLHKGIKPVKKGASTPKEDATDLFRYVDSFLIKSRVKDPVNFARIHVDMKRESVKDINLILDLLVQVDDVGPIYETLREIMIKDNPGKKIDELDGFEPSAVEIPNVQECDATNP